MIRRNLRPSILILSNLVRGATGMLVSDTTPRAQDDCGILVILGSFKACPRPMIVGRLKATLLGKTG